jgi:hypothetical protein
MDDRTLIDSTPLAFNVIIYGLCCILILKRKAFTPISIRSPTLLLITNFSNFLISSVLLLKEWLFEDNNFLTIFYYIFKFVMMASIFLRYERLLSCCNMNNDNVFNLKKYNDKRRSILEKVYIRKLLVSFILVSLIIIILNVMQVKYFEITNNEKQDIGQYYVWVIWHFLELIILMTYIYRISYKNFEYNLTKEIVLLFIFSFFYSNIISHNLLYNNNNEEFIFFSLLFLHICLLLNGYIPIFMTCCCSKRKINFSFTTKLANNLYLFLTNEKCYQAFSEYLNRRGNNGSFFLKVYTRIMKFKLDIYLKKYKGNEGFNEANGIYNDYFLTDKIIVIDVIKKVKEKCQVLKINEFDEGMFDDGLQYVFEELNKRFSEFRGCEKFFDLIEEINLDSFIQCKMFNIGLINKY